MNVKLGRGDLYYGGLGFDQAQCAWTQFGYIQRGKHEGTGVHLHFQSYSFKSPDILHNLSLSAHLPDNIRIPVPARTLRPVSDVPRVCRSARCRCPARPAHPIAVPRGGFHLCRGRQLPYPYFRLTDRNILVLITPLQLQIILPNPQRV